VAKKIPMSDFSKSGLCKDYSITINGTSKELNTYKLLIFSASRLIRKRNEDSCFDLMIPGINPKSLISLMNTLLEIIENRYKHRDHRQDGVEVTPYHVQIFITHLEIEYPFAKDLVKAYVNIDNANFWMMRASQAGKPFKDLFDYCHSILIQSTEQAPSSPSSVINKKIAT
jgi:hypothetical protein